MEGKFRKRSFKPKKPPHSTGDTLKRPPATKPGERFFCDFGFVRSSDWKEKDEDGKLITSVNGYRSYCLLIDETKTRHPPIDFVKNILDKYKDSVSHGTIKTDQGKELGWSESFAKMVSESKYSLELTGANASAQNALAEKPNQDLGRMMNCLLHGAGLSGKHWSYVLRHSVYLKNHLCHRSLNLRTPFEQLTSHKPDLSKLRVFGSRVHVKKTGLRKAKLDSNNTTGTFMTYAGTNDNVVLYDEAHMSVPRLDQPPMPIALERAGLRPPIEHDTSQDKIASTPDAVLKVKSLSDKATIPLRGTDGAAGLDLYSSENPGEIIPLSTDISLELKDGTYGQIHSRSGLALKGLVAIAGVIDSDYRGEIKVILHNVSTKTTQVKCGDHIAQMIIHNIQHHVPEIVSSLQESELGNKGFGSTDAAPSSSEGLFLILFNLRRLKIPCLHCQHHHSHLIPLMTFVLHDLYHLNHRIFLQFNIVMKTLPICLITLF